jgi:translocation and assembly module TamB
MRLLLAGVVGLLLVGGTLALVLYLRSPQFDDLVRQKVVTSLEDATGGRVDLGSFHWSLAKLDFEANNLTLHGLEPSTAAPLAQVATIRVRAHVVSLLQKRVDLTYLELDRPQINLIVAADGKTNLPEPRVKSASDPVQQLFDLAIGRAELHGGQLQINDRQLPLDLSANDIVLATSFDRSDRRYDGTLSVGKINAKYQDYRDLPLAAQTEFSVWPTRAQIKRLMLQSQNSHAELSGAVNNFSNPETHLNYSATIDLPQAAAIARVSGIRKGTAIIDGSGSFAPGQYSTSGKLSARDIEDIATGLQLRNASLRTDFQASNAGLKLNNLAGQLLGGEVRGKAEVVNGAPGRGTAALNLAGVSLTEASRLLSSPAMPLEKLKPAGTLDGGLNLTWKGTPTRGIAEFDLRVSAPAQPAADRLALSGVIRGSYDLNSGLVELRPLQLSTPATQIDASGQIGSRTTSLSTSLQTTSLTEIDDILNALGQPPIPMQLAGHASFHGTISGELRSPEIAGHLQANQFSYLYAPAPSPNATQPQPQLIHVDSFSGNVSYSKSKVALDHSIIQSGATTLNLDGSAALENGNFVDDSAFELHAVMHNGDVTSIQKMLGTDYPLTGDANVTLQASGTKAMPDARGSFALTKATAYGRVINSLSGDVSLQGHDLKLTNAELKAPGGTVFGSGAYNLTSQEMIADLHSEDIQLAHVPELQLEKLSTAGVANFKLHAAGTPQNPAVDAHLHIDKLVLNQEHVGALTLDAVTHGQQMVITGRSNFQHAVLTIDGNVGMQGNLPGTLDVQFRDLDIDPFLTEEIKGQITAHSAVAGKVHVAGPFREPEKLTGGLNVDSFHAEFDKISVQTDGPIEIALSGGTLDFKRFALSSADTELKITGTAGLARARRLQLQAAGSVNMALLQTLNPELTSSGKATVDVQVRGTISQPLITGTVQVAGVSVSDIDLPAALSDLNGSLVFNQSRLEIEKMIGHVGGGTVEFAGYIGYANGLTFNMTSEGNDIRFRYSGLSVTANQELKVQGTSRNATISGDITITRFAQIPSADLAAAFANASPPIPNANSPLNSLHLDVHVRSTPELTVQTSLAKLSGDVDLRLKGTALNPILLGRVNIAQGDFKINGQKYYLERGDITFANPVRIDPLLDVEAKTRVRDFDITIGLHGTLERLSTTYRSDPPLSSEDIISLLTLGRTQQDYNQATGSGGANLGEATGNAVIGAAINQVVSNRVSRLFGVSAIRINPAVGGPDNNPNARLTVEQQVSSNVTITYITNLARSAQQVLEFEYNVTRDYTINAIRDENGVVSFDLLIRKRRK